MVSSLINSLNLYVNPNDHNGTKFPLSYSCIVPKRVCVHKNSEYQVNNKWICTDEVSHFVYVFVLYFNSFCHTLIS